jgi:hypothetical protein
MRGLTIVLLPFTALGLSGCLAKTALDVATAPVRVASKAVDLATTSQSEADEKRGREIRKREERLGQLGRQRDKLEKRCIEGDRRACNEAAQVNGEMQTLLPQIPAEPDEPR